MNRCFSAVHVWVVMTSARGTLQRRWASRKGPLPAERGLPELDVEPRCRMCKLAFEPGGAAVVRRAHILHARDDVGSKALTTLISGDVAALGVRRLDHRTVRRHMQRHLRDELVAGVPGAAAEPLGFFNTIAPNVEEEWGRLWDLADRMAARVAEVDADPDAFRTADGGVDYQALAKWAGAADRTRAVLAELAKLRNSDRVHNALIEAVVRRFSVGVAYPLGTELRGLVQAARRGEHVVDGLTALLDDGLAVMFRRAAEAAASEAKQNLRMT